MPKVILRGGRSDGFLKHIDGEDEPPVIRCLVPVVGYDRHGRVVNAPRLSSEVYVRTSATTCDGLRVYRHDPTGLAVPRDEPPARPVARRPPRARRLPRSSLL